MRQRGIAFATITLAAGISSTGDPELDRRLPFDEPYRISEATARAIRSTRANGGRIVAIGTTVVRALEQPRRPTGSCKPVTASRISAWARRAGSESSMRSSQARMSPTLVTTSLLRAFLDETTLVEAGAALEALGYRTHEFGDSVLIERSNRMVRDAAA